MTGPDSRRFGRAMGRLAAGVVALGAVPAVATAGPIVARDGNAVHPALLLVLLVYGGAFVVILGAIAYGVRRSSFAAIAQELSVLRALGQEPGVFVRAQARRGLLVGARASAGLVALGAIALQARALFTPDASHTGLGLNPWALPAYALGVGMAAVATAAAFALAARHAIVPRAPMRLALRRLRAEAPPVDTEPFRGPRRALALAGVVALGAAVAVSLAGQAWLRFAPQRFDISADPSNPRPSRPHSWWAAPSHQILTLAMFATLAALASWLCVRSLTWLGRRWSARRGTTLVVAGDGIARRTLERTAAVATTVVVLGLTAYHAAAGGVESARYSAADALKPDITVVPTFVDSNEIFAAGYAQQVVAPAVVEALMSDPRLIVVPVGFLYSDPEYRADPVSTSFYPDKTIEDHWLQDSVAVLEPARRGDAYLAQWRALGLGGEVLLTSQSSSLTSLDGGPGPAVFAVDDVPHDTFQTEGYGLRPMADAAWATPRFGEPPVNALFVYLADPSTATNQGRDGLASQIINDVVPEGSRFGTMSTGAGWPGTAYNPAQGSGRNVALSLAGLLVAVGLTGALAAASARTRRRDLATMAALGARPASLRAAPALEAGVTTVVAASVGIAIGAAVAIVQAHPTLLAPGGPVDPGSTATILWWNATHAGWAYLGVMGAVAVAASTLVGSMFGQSLELRSPVGELREATKEGAL